MGNVTDRVTGHVLGYPMEFLNMYARSSRMSFTLILLSIISGLPYVRFCNIIYKFILQKGGSIPFEISMVTLCDLVPKN